MNKESLAYWCGLCAVLSAVAADAAGNFRYSTIDASYLHSDFDDVDTDGDGFRLSGSVEVHDNVFLFANYNDVDLDGPAEGRQ